MQTFLPYPDFLRSAEVLDKKRCWKQVVEAYQIIQTLEAGAGAWKNHPAVRMWEGHIPELKFYFNVFLIHCINQHKIKTKYKIYDHSSEFYPRQTIHDGVMLDMPWWMGDENFHRAMRSRLIEKNREFYLPLFPGGEGFNGGKYFWPVMETKTFRII